MAEADTAAGGRTRVRVFVDFWNFQLTLNERECRETNSPEARFMLDWKHLGKRLAAIAASEAGIDDHVFEGMNVYTSYDPKTEEGRRYRNWVATWLDRQPGVQVECRERRPKAPPRCSSCHSLIKICPTCHERMAGTVEKGVDTLIATDMIRMAWEDAYDLAVLATSDADLVPAVEFLNLRTRRVVQAGFPPLGSALATACWASFDVYKHRDSIRRS